MPNLSPFKMGLTAVSTLKATERFARVFCLYIALCNSYCIEALLQTYKTKSGKEKQSPFSRLELAQLKITLEETLMFHQWLKERKFVRDDFVDKQDGSECRALTRVKSYLLNFKKSIVRSGNGLKCPKFHQMLHVVDYIKRYGSPSNWDGGRGEHFGKTMVKDHARRTNHQKETLNFNIACRISESQIIDEISNVIFQNTAPSPGPHTYKIALVKFVTPSN